MTSLASWVRRHRNHGLLDFGRLSRKKKEESRPTKRDWNEVVFVSKQHKKKKQDTNVNEKGKTSEPVSIVWSKWSKWSKRQN